MGPKDGQIIKKCRVMWKANEKDEGKYSTQLIIQFVILLKNEDNSV
jgi:hypothetical protein